ncbi:MAG TPA: SUF system NifU family Fe-S cluster assembly protein [Thermoanaerobaculia bacterium]|nr:SUF system NifU family Fe-S cluster assembly protein [Thermoanaerobaculia bacterium]
MSDLSDLYQDVILDHSRRPRNFGALPTANHAAEGDNPLCGDRLTLGVEVRDGEIAGIAFEGSGCAISMASASLMTEAVRGRPVGEAGELSERFRRLLKGEGAGAEEGSAGAVAELEALGKLAALEGVKRYPMRVKCATLAWHTLDAALAAPATDPELVTTEWEGTTE